MQMASSNSASSQNALWRRESN